MAVVQEKNSSGGDAAVTSLVLDTVVSLARLLSAHATTGRHSCLAKALPLDTSCDSPSLAPSRPTKTHSPMLSLDPSWVVQAVVRARRTGTSSLVPCWTRPCSRSRATPTPWSDGETHRYTHMHTHIRHTETRRPIVVGRQDARTQDPCPTYQPLRLPAGSPLQSHTPAVCCNAHPPL